MKILERLRDVQRMSLYVDGTYHVAYQYDAQGRVTEERVTGAVNRVTTFEYDANDNISKEIYNDGVKEITKVYAYDGVTGNLSSVDCTSISLI